MKGIITIFDKEIINKPLHIEKTIDGIYVVGDGVVCKVENSFEAEYLIERLTYGLTFKK